MHFVNLKKKEFGKTRILTSSIPTDFVDRRYVKIDAEEKGTFLRIWSSTNAKPITNSIGKSGKNVDPRQMLIHRVKL